MSTRRAGCGAANELDTVGIARGDLTSTSEFTGELGFGDSWPLPLTADGIVTGARSRWEPWSASASR